MLPATSNFTRPAKLGGSENKRLASFSGRAYQQPSTGRDLTQELPSPNFATLVRPSPSNCVWGKGEALPATSHFTRQAKLGGSENKRLASFSGRAYQQRSIGPDLNRELPSPNFATLVRPSPTNCVWGRGKKLLATSNFTRPAKLRGSENKRLASFSGRAYHQPSTGPDLNQELPSPNIATLVRPSPTNCVWGRVKKLRSTRS